MSDVCILSHLARSSGCQAALGQHRWPVAIVSIGRKQFVEKVLVRGAHQLAARQRTALGGDAPDTAVLVIAAWSRKSTSPC